MKNFHNKALRKRNLHENQKVWLYNSHLKLFPGKLKSRWNCPYVITEIFDSGAVLIIDPKTRHDFKVNGQQLKPYLEVEPPLTIQEEALHRIWYALRRWRLVSRQIVLFSTMACSSINQR
ncbi:unnamed protein product [Spirodela intermedia]|uniref:Uncharacterized protein n=1 Tax=Spirodela intermedia TaxID=51605 RepID=A0A7I8KTV6_SPIIN|nr:unnamed protein product [Spirodela intermedia]